VSINLMHYVLTDDTIASVAAEQLRSCLPQMVVDIIEEKMEHEYRAGTFSLLKHINTSRMLNRDKNDDDFGGDDDDDDDDAVKNHFVS